ncbi:MAG: hypothetical protein IJ489_03490 [Clostridia bacterium]|nr:hypothetical protein [Clostridia bacterium]
MNDRQDIGLEKLREAFQAVNAEEWEHTDKIPKEELIYSEAYERKMEALIRVQKRPYLRYFNSVGKRAAMIALVILMTFGLSMSISAVRKPIVNFFIRVHTSFTELFFAKDDIEKAPERIEALYTFDRLPPKSEWLTQFINEKDVTTTWANDTVNLTLVQTTLDTSLFVSDGVAELRKIELAGREVTVIEKFGVKVYLWNTEEYAFHLVVKGYLGEEETARIMDSLTVGDIKQTLDGTR